MAYDPFRPSVPTTAGSPTPTRQATIDDTRKNLMALRDLLVAFGMVQGFDYSVAGGSAEEPAQVFYKKGTEWVRLDLTWGTTGGEDGNVTKFAMYYSSNSGGAYDPLADDAGEYVATYTYDGSGNCTAVAWGSTP
jgi:hypothetical protein